MAEAIISLVMEQLASYVQEEVGLVVGVREEVRKLTATLKVIQGVLADAERKQVRHDSVKAWLEELKNIFYTADDVLDEWRTKTVMDQLQGHTHRSNKVLSYLFSPCSCFKHVGVRYDISHRIQDISKNLDVLAQQRQQFGLTVIQTDVSSGEWQARSLTSSIFNLSEIRGREHDKEVIISRLLGRSNHQDNALHVVSIVGMGGFGKTTLAKLVFHDDRVQNNFEKKLWVCVSEPFELIRVAKTIIEQVTGKAPDVNQWETLHQHLCDSIKGKKFVLVLDDVWTDNSEHWDPLKHSLDGGALGSRIMVTTRDHRVAKMMRSSHVHDIQKLSDEDSWLLLRDIALGGRQGVAENFEIIGRKIAMKCKGVPLAIKTLAGNLCLKDTKQEWTHVLRSDLWDVEGIEQKFLPSLLLSYNSLPSNIKQCFIYCAIFRKDAVLIKDDLVKLWMAQGFLGADGKKELEKIGENYFDRLVMCSFFQNFKEEDGDVIECKMHDLVHDFAQFLALKECLCLEMNDMEFDGNKIRHICSYGGDGSVISKATNLRTLMFMSYSRMADSLIDKLPCLRTLDLGYTNLNAPAKEVGMLVHLRYLRFRNSEMLELPETICNLYNLQSFILNGCMSLGKLPNGIGNLKNLRHLEIEDTNNLSYMPSGIGRLCSLRTLTKFVVGGSSSLLGCKISDLKSLNNLGGCLELRELRQVSDLNEATEAELKKKKNIRKLRLDFGFTLEENVEGSGMEKGVLERLEPHENLEYLIVSNYQGYQLPFWMENSSTLANLVGLELIKLDMWEGSDVNTNTIVPNKEDEEEEDGCSMGSLKKLTIKLCFGLKVIPNYLFPHTLRELWISDCPELRMQPSVPPLLEKLHLGGDTGNFPESLQQCSPSLKDLTFYYWKGSSMPKDFNQLKAVESLYFYECKTLDFELKELKHFTTLRHLRINSCPRLEQRFRSSEDEWKSFLSHVPDIQINDKKMTD